MSVFLSALDIELGLIKCGCSRVDLRGDMRRREFTAALGAAIVWPVAGLSLEASKHRIAYLALADISDATFVKERLRELGYEEGTNIIFDFRSAHGRSEALAELAFELVKTNPDVIITGFGTATAKAAQAATRTIPVVFTNVGDPIGSGIVESLSRPGANVTGLSGQAAELSGKRLELLRQLIPGIRTIAVLAEPGAPYTLVALPQLQKAANALGLQLAICDVRESDDVGGVLAAAARSEAAGIVLLETPVLIALRQQIVDAATRVRMPVVSSVREFVDAGGLMSYGPDVRQINRRAAELADKIMKGARPEEIPVEQPTKFNLIVNLKASRSLGLSIPATLLAVADEVIE
jgi:putative tryptophan/tyrosine transport system substrate-binding protein